MVPNGVIHYTYFRINTGGGHGTIANEIEWHGRAFTRAGSLTTSHVSAGFINGTFWLGWKHWTYPHYAALSMNEGDYGLWSDPIMWHDVGMVDPPSFAYDSTDGNLIGRMTWTSIE